MAYDPFKPESQTTLGDLLASLATNISNRYYKGQTIHIDGYTFTNCCFHNCILVTITGTFTINSCTVANCTMRFGPHAIRVIKLFNLLAGVSPWATFNAEIAADGAVTIK